MYSSCHAVVKEKLEEFYDQDIPAVFPRDLSLGNLKEPARGNLVNVVTGVRRCGKTYRLFQEMHRIQEAGCDRSSILYFNFDDERLKPYETALLNDVIETFYAHNPHARSRGAFFFFDEIQEVPEWGAFMRRMVDTQRATIYVTGSSSKMLSLQLASEFRGRALTRELFPMSFVEYLRYHQADGLNLPCGKSEAESFSEPKRALLCHYLERYLGQGGFIGVQNLEPADATQLLQEYANRTINYDIIERYQIANPQAAALFLARCLASSARELSINKCYNDFKSRQISVSRETLSQLLSHYEESYLLFPLKSYSVALADNPRSSAKVYAADPALFSAFSPAPSLDDGQRLETAVYNKLRRTLSPARPGYLSRAFVGKGSQRQEIDFVIGDALALEPIQLIQVAAKIDAAQTRSREVRALEKAMSHFAVDNSLLITTDESDIIETSTGTIRVVPAWQWLL